MRDSKTLQSWWNIPHFSPKVREGKQIPLKQPRLKNLWENKVKSRFN